MKDFFCLVWFRERDEEIVKSSARTLDPPIKRVWDVDRLFLLLSSHFKKIVN